MNFAWTCLIAEHGLMFPRFVPLVKGTNEQLMSGDSRILRRTKVQGSQRPVISGMRSPTNSRVGLASGKGQRTRGNSGSGIRDSHYTAVICAGRAIARARSTKRGPKHLSGAPGRTRQQSSLESTSESTSLSRHGHARARMYRTCPEGPANASWRGIRAIMPLRYGSFRGTCEKE